MMAVNSDADVSMSAFELQDILTLLNKIFVSDCHLFPDNYFHKVV